MSTPRGRAPGITQAMLLALSAEPLGRSALARKASLSEADAQTALEQLIQAHLAIEEEGGFELTGPLSWFGSFEHALAYLGRKQLRVQADSGRSHLYLCDVRVKGGLPAGHPRTQTVSVFACGTSATSARALPDAAPLPECESCREAAGWISAERNDV